MNCHIFNDLFHHIEMANLNAYADDERLSTRSNTDPKELDRRLQHEITIANNWYEQNGMIVNLRTGIRQ